MGIFYKSLRVGKNGLTFHLLKFRTFKEGKDGGSPTASVDDPRMTTIGRFLRRTKLDELPTLWNLLRGDITIVGPRPDVPSEIFELDHLVQKLVLSVKPGLISPATLWNINEDEILKGEKDPHKVYCEKIRPVKYQLNAHYVVNKSLFYDLRIIAAFFLRSLGIKKDLFKVLPPWVHAFDAVKSYRERVADQNTGRSI